MFVSRPLALTIPVLLVFTEGILFTVVSSSPNIINTYDGQQLHSPILEKYGGESKANVSKRSLVHQDLSSCNKCGMINRGRNWLILKGTAVKPQYKYPWIVALQRNGETFCGGSLLNQYYILTAAHCLVKPDSPGEYVNREDIQVAFMTYEGKVKPGPPLAEVIPHTGFSMTSPDHDIALLKLRNKVICDKFTLPICLPSPWHVVKNDDLFTIIGWGTFMYQQKVMSKILLEANIKNVPYINCQNHFPEFPASMAENYYCLHGVDKSQSPCNGDSGGPMFQERQNGETYLYGITSLHTHEHCDPNDYFLYTSVPKHISWIKSIMGLYKDN